MISENWLPAVRKAIRDYIVLPTDEPVDLVLLAAFLVNHVPHREFPIWLNIIGPQGSGKTMLLNLLIDHPSVWKLPDRLSLAYFFSAKTLQKSALYRIDKAKARILMMSDLATLSESISHQYQGDIYTQLLNIYDGFYKAEAGLHSEELLWRRPDNERLGWLGAGTEAFYNFFKRTHNLGGRFLVYFYDPSRYYHWTQTHDLSEIHRRQPNQAENKRVAKEQVQQFLNGALEQLGGYEYMRVSDEELERINKAATFVSRILAAGKRFDRGTRRSLWIGEICKMIAYMNGRNRVTAADVDIGVRMVFSQMEPIENRIVSYALERTRLKKTWTRAELLADLGLSRRVAEPIIETLVEIEILEQLGAGGRGGFSYKVTKDTFGMVMCFDPRGELFKRPQLRPELALVQEEESW